jgi:2-methylisocitrate lyase-like PEP mutase family enzyme
VGLLDRMMTRAELYRLIEYQAWEEAERRYLGDD